MAMKTGLRFLMAAKKCEMADLEQLAKTSALVDTTTRMIHALQRERGLSNLYLGSAGQQASAERVAQIQASQGPESALRNSFDALNTAPTALPNGARLFSRVAFVLHGLEALPALRLQVSDRVWAAERATDAYSHLISGLLAVVFEAADTATDPDISRLLVALFHFMQGKEFVGQERATGAAMFAAGHTTPAQQQRLQRLIESQARCLEVFADFAGPALLHLWTQHQQPANHEDLERLRRLLSHSDAQQTLPTTCSEPWFAGCSERIDLMRAIEEHLCRALQTACERKLANVALELREMEQLKSTLPTAPSDEPLNLSFFDTSVNQETQAPANPLGSQLDRAVLDLLHAQAGRLQKVSDELETVRASLNERKVVERAKGLLMAHRQLSEDDAHRTLRQMAMNQGQRMAEVAEAILTTADVLPVRGR